MMPPSGMSHLDLNDPQDVQLLVDRGWAWRSGPKTLQRIFRLIADGSVTRKPEAETPEVTAYLDKVAPIQPEQPAPLEPGEVLPEPEEPPVG